MLQFFNLTHQFVRAHFASLSVLKQQIAHEHKGQLLFACSFVQVYLPSRMSSNHCANEKSFLFTHAGAAPPMKRPRERWMYLARVTRGYNCGQLCRSLRVPSSDLMKSWRR